MTEPHQTFTPDPGEEIIYVTPNCLLSSDLALRFAPVVAAVLEESEKIRALRKLEISDIVGRQPNWLS